MQPSEESPQRPNPADTIAEENVGRLLHQAYRPELPRPEFIEQVGQALQREAAARRQAAATAARRARGTTDSQAARRPRWADWQVALGLAAAILVAAGVVDWATRRAPMVERPEGAAKNGSLAASGPRAGRPTTKGGPLGSGEFDNSTPSHAPEGPAKPALEAGAITARARPEAPPGRSIAWGDSIATGPGQKQRVSLPDGSVLFVNENASLHLEGDRRVKLTRGEIYVEVAPRSAAAAPSSSSRGSAASGENRPGQTFYVSTPSRTVRALGTRFAVSALDEGTGVLVVQGKVRVDGVAEPLVAGQQFPPQRGGPGGGAPLVVRAPRATHLLDWTRDLIAASESPLVPGSEHAGGALVAVDPNGQEARFSLRKYHVDVHIEDGFARTTIDQTYFNHLNARLEGTFYFPLPPEASISRLAMYVGPKLMEGGMVERDYGREVFESIKYKMLDPALLEWVDGSTFKMRVFPLEGRQEKRIILSYTERLPSLYGRSKYRFPAGHNLGTVRDWSAHLHVRRGNEMRWHSPSHAFEMQERGGDLILTAAASDVRLDQDLVLELAEARGGRGFSAPSPAARGPFDRSSASPQLATAADDPPRYSAFAHEGSRYLMVRWRPRLAVPPQPVRRDWIFLFESSADRDPLLARVQIDAIRTILENADHGDTFALVTAGTRVRAMADGQLPATPGNIALATAFLNAAHLVGALDLEKALAAVEPFVEGAENPVLVHLGSGTPILGERGNDVLARKVPPRATYVGVGVGRRWNRAFMKLAAERSGGYFTRINPDETVSWRAFDLLATLNTPRLLNLQVQGGGPWLYDAESLADGEEFSAVARFDATGPLPTAIEVSGTLPGRDVRHVLPVNVSASNAGYLPRMWARLEIERLLAEDGQANKERIVSLSKAMYVMSPYTSLLVLENEEMYEQYKVDRGRKDHWAMYDCPDTIEVVHEPLLGPELPATGASGKPGSEAEKDDSPRARVRKSLESVVVRRASSLVPWSNPWYGYYYVPLTTADNWSLFYRNGTVSFAVPHDRHAAVLVTHDELGITHYLLPVHRSTGRSSGMLVPADGRDIFAREAGRLANFTGNPWGSATEGRELGRWGQPSLRLWNGGAAFDVGPPMIAWGKRPPIGYSFVPGGDGFAPLLQQSRERNGWWIDEGDRSTERNARILIVVDASDSIVLGTDIWREDNVTRDLRTVRDRLIRSKTEELLPEQRDFDVLIDLIATTLRPTTWDLEKTSLTQEWAELDWRRRPAGSAFFGPYYISKETRRLDEYGLQNMPSVLLPFDRFGLERLRLGDATTRPWDRSGRGPWHVDWERQRDESGLPDGRWRWLAPEAFAIGGELAMLSSRGEWRERLRRNDFDERHSSLGAYYDGLSGGDDAAGEYALATQAEREEFVRRVMLDLVGTPPTPQDFRRFIDRGTPEDAPKLLKDLLSPAGQLEYWARRRLHAIRQGSDGDFVTAARARGLAYQPPAANIDPGMFADLVSYAPGFNTTTADVLAVLEAEVSDLNAAARQGKIDPAARALFDRHERSGSYTLTAGGVPDTVEVQFDAAGRHRYERRTTDGLGETVVCDGRTLWHLYPEIGLGTRRGASRFHRRWLADLVPWITPRVEELAHGADVVVVGERTVAVIPHEVESADEAANKAGSRRLQLQFVFGRDGRLAERRIVETTEGGEGPQAKVLLRIVFESPSLVVVRDKNDKELARREIPLIAAAAPDWVPATKGLVVCSMPQRTLARLCEDRKLALDGSYDDWQEDDAIDVIAAACGQRNVGLALEITRQRFFSPDRKEGRLGFSTLLVSTGLTRQRHQESIGAPLGSPADQASERFDGSPLAQYLGGVLAWSDNEPWSSTIDGNGPDDGFLAQLAALWNLQVRRYRGEQNGYQEGEPQRLKSDALQFANKAVSPRIAFATMRGIVGHELDPAQAAQAAHVFARCRLPEHAYTARYERARALLLSGRPDGAQREFTRLYKEALAAGDMPPFDGALRQAFDADRKLDAWYSLIRETAARVLHAGDRRAAIQLAWQCRAAGDDALGDELLDRALVDVPEPERPALFALAFEYLWISGNTERADDVLSKLLDDPQLARQPAPWRLAAESAGRRNRLARAVACEQRSLDLEYAALEGSVDVESIRAQYGSLMNRYSNLARALADPHRPPPDDVVAKIVGAADNWRRLDVDPTEACHAAALALDSLGAEELAWDYLTTPLAEKPNEASPWVNLASSLASRGNVDLAHGAYRQAYAAEPTNAEILWNHAQMLKANGRLAESVELCRKIVERTWQPRFGGIVSQAQQVLSEVGPPAAATMAH